MRVPALALCVLAALIPLPSVAQTSSATDAKVQNPELNAPQRASLAGQLATVAFSPSDVSRGAFSLPSPFSVPSERGPLLAQIFPSYSPEQGISEWGTGWGTALAIWRMRLNGDLDYATDDLTGPFGRMVKGTDGSWYPVNLSSLVRVTQSGDTCAAFLPDGTVMTFGGAAAVSSARGTFAWHLTEVRSATGRKTKLEWSANASGRPFLSAVSYGGFGDEFQYRVELAYEPLAQAFEDYRSGVRRVLDQRVKTIVVLARHAQTGLFEERWHYELSYEGEGLGPGFYLSSVEQIFRSGARAPAFTYAYHLAKDRLATLELVPAPHVASILSTLGLDALQPTKSSAFDLEEDGLLDLEHQYEYKLAHQTQDGFAFEALPPAPPDAYPYCRRPPNANNPPRALVRLRAGSGDDTPYVVDLRTDTYGANTYFSACNRVGQRLAAQTLSGNWAPGATVRVVDVNRDHRPDLVRVSSGSYRVLPNASTATSFGFGTLKTGALTPSLTVDTAWAHDVNGDGIPDLVARAADPSSSTNSQVFVWFGKGGLEFETAGRAYSFRWANGALVVALKEYGFTWVDANKDGLVDVLLTRTTGNTALLFVNKGTEFQETAVPGLRAVDLSTSKPVIQDLRGTGNTEITYTKSGQGLAIALDGPETGLLRSADDGKGTVLRFDYARAPAAAGARQRESVLATMTVESSGFDVTAYSYAYAAPRLHSTGKLLLGYGEVARAHALGDETAQFLTDDRYGSVLAGSVTRDLSVSGVEQFRTVTYSDAVYQGVPWMRTESEQTGYRTVGGAGETASETIRTLAYWNEVCPSRTEEAGANGTLVRTIAYGSFPAFANALACIPVNVVEEGEHVDPSLDFRHETSIGRNAAGLVTSVSSVAPEGTWILQNVTYTPEWLVETISSPGNGSASVAYDPITRLPIEVAAADGVVTQVIERDPVTDALTSLRTSRGVLVHDQSFRYDGLERVQDAWDDIGEGGPLAPDVRYTYAFATAATPASTRVSTLVDVADSAVAESVDLLTARGDRLAVAQRIPEGWAFGRLTWRSPSAGQTTSFLRPTLPASVDPAALDHGALFAGSEEVEHVIAGPFGVSSDQAAWLHVDVARRVTEALYLDSGRVVRDSWENGTYRTTQARDASGNVVASWDEIGTAWAYSYDALGRLREVLLPDGKRHRAAYDGHGRVSRVEREGIATVESRFDPASGLLVEKRYLSPAGSLRRTVAFSYDAVGRVSAKTDSTPAGATKRFEFYWDGASPEAPLLADRPGLLTAVVGDGYVKRLQYRPDGKLSRRTLELGSWRKIVTDLVYDEAGGQRSQTVSVHAGATPLVVTTTRSAHDAHGRLRSTSLDDRPFATYGYDQNGLLASVSFANGDSVTLQYDGLTRRLVGAAQATAGYLAAASQRMDTRGLVASETIQVGALSLQRDYGYSAQRFLTASTDARKAYGYSFDASGLPTRIVEDGAAKDIIQTGSTIVAGQLNCTLDDLGRTVQRGDLSLEYGPDGQVARAQRGSRVWTFLYDEAGHRLAKLEGGAHVAAYLEEGYLDAAELVQPVRVAGRSVGVLRNGVFESVATDLRGTVLAEANGTARIASPFGARDVHPSTSAALDYVEKGYDADLGTIRMGVRDYDPELNRFTTPDPLLLEAVDAALKSPRDTNLYGYARNLPNLIVDPSGLLPDLPDQKASAHTYNVLMAAEADGLPILQAVEGSPTLRPMTVQEAARSGVLTDFSSHPGSSFLGAVGEALVKHNLEFDSSGRFGGISSFAVLQPATAVLPAWAPTVVGDSMPDLLVTDVGGSLKVPLLGRIQQSVVWMDTIGKQTGGRVGDVNHGPGTVVSLWEVTVSRNFKNIYERAAKVAGWAGAMRSAKTGGATVAAVLAIDRGAFFELTGAQRDQIVKLVTGAGGYVRLFRDLTSTSAADARVLAGQLGAR